MSGFDLFVGIDWSGAKGARQPGIAVALCDPDGTCGLVRPPGGGAWSREAVLGYLIDCPPGTLAGMDFAFSLPWPEAGPLPPGLRQPADAHQLWRMVDDLCGAEPHLYAGPVYHPQGGWLADYMFTKLTGRELWRGPAYATDRLRLTERMISPPPASAFKIVGAKTVGPSSFTGMRMLTRLKSRPDAAIWPFEPDNPAGLTIAEVYPGYYKRRAKTALGSAAGTTEILAFYGARLDGRGPADGHEWDALVAAAALRHFAGDPLAFAAIDPIVRREGWIFGVKPA